MSARPDTAQKTPDTPTDKQICLYIAEMCAELAYLARRPRLRTINYLLDMARLEAERTGKGLPDRPPAGRQSIRRDTRLPS